MTATRRKLLLIAVFVSSLVLIQQRWRIALLLDPIDPETLLAPVVLYSTQWCGYCAKTRQYLELTEVPYTEKDIEASEAARTEFETLGGRGVPLILVGNQRLHGFDPQQLHSALKRLSQESD